MANITLSTYAFLRTSIQNMLKQQFLAVGNGGGEGYGDLGLTVLEGASRKGDLDNGLGILDTGTGSLQFGLEGYSISCDRTDCIGVEGYGYAARLGCIEEIGQGVMTPAAVSTTPTSTV